MKCPNKIALNLPKLTFIWVLITTLNIWKHTKKCTFSSMKDAHKHNQNVNRETRGQ